MTAGAIALSSLTGTEQVTVDNGGAVLVQCTTSQIAGLSGSGVSTDIVNTPITTVGNGVLTAAAISGLLITRTGPTAAYTDTTDTAAAIVATFPGFVSGATFFFTVKNVTAFPETIVGGTGVTMSITNIVGPFEEGEYYGTVGGTAASPTIVVSHLQTGAISTSSNLVSPQNAALNTVGAGTVLAAAINGGLVARGGTQIAAFTDTTDTAANIIAGNPGLIGKVGTTSLFTYTNNTTFPATLVGGTGVTISGGNVISPNGGWAVYLLTYSAAATITMQQVYGDNDIPPSQFTTAALSVGTLAAGQVTGAGFVVLTNTGATPGTQTTRTAAQMLADFVGAYIGLSYTVRIVNTGAGTFTLAGGTGVTITGTATVAQNVFRDYVVTFNTGTTATFQSVGSGVSP